MHTLKKITKVVYILCCLDMSNLLLHQQLLEDYQKIYRSVELELIILLEKMTKNSIMEGASNYWILSHEEMWSCIFIFCLF